MTWTRPGDLRAQVQVLWDRGELLASLVTGAAIFPRRMLLRGPNSSDVTSRFEEVRGWIAQLRTTPCCRIEMREFTHRVFGNNAIPRAIWLDSIEAAFALIEMTSAALRFRSLCDSTRRRQPMLLNWLAKRPLRALELADQWQRLLDVVTWMQDHPRPAIYLRQVDIPGTHSKFIESHSGVLTELLNATLPPEAVDESCGGAGQFAARYGFRDKPTRIRFRVIDDQLSVLAGIRHPDVALDARSFAALDMPVERVFITENEINFLAFPAVPGGIVIFGAGYGWDALAAAAWLRRCTVHYWGDIDTHGFAILDRLRNRFEHVASFLMDRATLMAHEAAWGHEDSQVRHDLPRLNATEGALFDDLRDNHIREGLRLEQEMVRFGCVESALRALVEAHEKPADIRTGR